MDIWMHYFESRLPWEYFEHTVSDHGVYIYMFGGRDIFNNLVNSLRMVKGLGKHVRKERYHTPNPTAVAQIVQQLCRFLF